MKFLKVKNKKYKLPIFCPDATRAVIRSVDAQDLVDSGLDGVCVNTFHLLSDPGLELLQKSGGVKKFMNFDGLTISDSGGFQVFSLIYSKGNKGKIIDEGAVFYSGGQKNPRKNILTPEKSIQSQFAIGSDIMICLDDCPSSDVSEATIKKTVDRTIEWARRCKLEFEKQIKKREFSFKDRPLLFGVVQGGDSQKLRLYCLKELEKIGFDGYCFGGWVPDAGNPLQIKLMQWTAKLMPDNKYKYALGLGKLQDLVIFTKVGYTVFDCVLPTRDARHARLYEIKKPLKNLLKSKNPAGFFKYLYIDKQKHAQELKPISKFCDCLVCQKYSRAYLNHLFKLKEPLALRLATLHNLRIYALVIEQLRKEI